jgi:serine/threonine protein kinase
VKRLSRNTTLKDLLREYNALRIVKKRRHPNIVEVLSAFRYGDQDVHYNLSFPLASGNLKHLFRGSLHNTLIDKHSSSLWSQFEGLAGAIAYLHDDCQIAHTDLKPSNILLYETGGVPPLVCKIADFGLAVDLQKTNTWTLESQEAKSAWKYDPPEVRAKTSGTKGATFMEDTVVSAKQYKCADIWKLGAVFTELSTFLVFGSRGVTNFRQSITTSRDNITSDALSDSLFDDGVKVKWEVLNAIRILCQCNPFVAEIRDLLERMLAEDIKRPSAGLVWKTLTEVSLSLNETKRLQAYFLRQAFVLTSTIRGSLPSPGQSQWHEYLGLTKLRKEPKHGLEVP